MKPFYKLLFAAAMMLAAMTASAQTTFEVGDFAYQVDNVTDKLVACTGLSAQGRAQTTINLNIPGLVPYNGTNYRVYRISVGAFEGLTNTTSTVEIDWGVKSIDRDAFLNCTNIITVRLPSSVQYVGTRSFWGCGLEEVYYSSYNTKPLDQSAWENQGEGITLYLPRHSLLKASDFSGNGMSCWENFEIAYDDKLSDFDFFNARWCVPFLGENEFLPPTTPFDVYLIDGADTGTTLRPGARSINYAGFTFVYKGVVANALEYHTNYTTIDLDGCSEMTFIGADAFFNCTNLTTLKIPASVTSLGLPSMITSCWSLQSVDVNSENQTYATYKGAVYNKALTTLYRVPEGKTGWVSYPATLEKVGVLSHGFCSQITGANLPYGVKTIESSAYQDTRNLVLIQIPSSVTSLSNDYVFNGTNPNLSIWCNMNNPPTVTTGNYFGGLSNDNSGMNLLIPYGKQAVYNAAGWTGFATVNDRSTQAFDFNLNNLCYTVISTESYTANDGTTYDGRVKLVCAANTAGDGCLTYDIPAGVTCNGKTYAVTKIGEDAFNNITNNFTVTGCLNVETIGECAFQNQPVTSYSFTHNLKNIFDEAFDGASLTGTVQIPYGIENVYSEAFANGKYSQLVIPSSIQGLVMDFCKNTTTLQELVFNDDFSHGNWYLGTVPSNCYIRVPVGLVEKYKQNSSLSDRKNYITAGAYDYACNNNYAGTYFLSILNTTPVTYNGTTYAGEAKYVYHPNIKNATSSYYYFDDFEEDKTVSNDVRSYLITEIGDSCLARTSFSTITNYPSALTRIGNHAFYGSAFTGNSAYTGNSLAFPSGLTDIGDFAFGDTPFAVDNMVLPSGLTTIGRAAFQFSQLTGEVKIPSSLTTLGDFAFAHTSLSSLYFPGDMPTTFGKYVWAGLDIPTVWVPNKFGYKYLNAIESSWVSPSQYAKVLSVYINPTTTTRMFSAVVPTDLSGSGITAYCASDFDQDNPTQQLTLTQVDQASADRGLLLTNLTPGQEYRISRPAGDVSSTWTNWLVATAGYQCNIYQQYGCYYWDAAANPPHFVKPTEECIVDYGEAFLQVRSGCDDIYTNLWPEPMLARGDINGDGKVDVSDVNIIINIMLGKASASNYLGNADVNNDNKVDVSDVNIVINIMLGKE